jgi:hypothetical protein
LQNPLKFTQIGLKINHLATLVLVVPQVEFPFTKGQTPNGAK